MLTITSGLMDRIMPQQGREAMQYQIEQGAINQAIQELKRLKSPKFQGIIQQLTSLLGANNEPDNGAEPPGYSPQEPGFERPPV